jgi:hypothetical protein
VIFVDVAGFTGLSERMGADGFGPKMKRLGKVLGVLRQRLLNSDAHAGILRRLKDCNRIGPGKIAFVRDDGNRLNAA